MMHKKYMKVKKRLHPRAKSFTPSLDDFLLTKKSISFIQVQMSQDRILKPIRWCDFINQISAGSWKTPSYIFQIAAVHRLFLYHVHME